MTPITLPFAIPRDVIGPLPDPKRRPISDWPDIKRRSRLRDLLMWKLHVEHDWDYRAIADVFQVSTRIVMRCIRRGQETHLHNWQKGRNDYEVSS